MNASGARKPGSAGAANREPRSEPLYARLRRGVLTQARLDAAARCGHGAAGRLCGVAAQKAEQLPGVELLDARERRLLACDYAEHVLPEFEREWPEITAHDVWPEEDLATWYAGPRRLITVARLSANRRTNDRKLSAAVGDCNAAYERVRSEGGGAEHAAGAALATVFVVGEAHATSSFDPDDERLRNEPGLAAARARRARQASSGDETAERAWQRARLAEYLLGDVDLDAIPGTETVKTRSGEDTGCTLMEHLACGRPDLSRADLKHVDLIGDPLRLAVLEHADLSGARLGGADLIGARLAGARLRGADLTEALMSDADLTGADLGATDVTRAQGLSIAALATCASIEGIRGLGRDAFDQLAVLAPHLIEWWPLGLPDGELGALIKDDGRLPSFAFARRLEQRFRIRVEIRSRLWRIGGSGQPSYLDASEYFLRDARGSEEQVTYERVKEVTGLSGQFWKLLAKSGVEYDAPPDDDDAGVLYRLWLSSAEAKES